MISLFPVWLAVGTEPDEFQTVLQDVISLGALESVHIQFERRTVNVVHAPAFRATDMVVLIEVGVEPALGAGDVELADGAVVGEYVEVPVDRTQADPGKALADHVVQFLSRGVGGELAEFLQDHLPLLGVALHGRFSANYPESVLVIIIISWGNVKPDGESQTRPCRPRILGHIGRELEWR
jgi:hypothetical protein